MTSKQPSENAASAGIVAETSRPAGEGSAAKRESRTVPAELVGGRPRAEVSRTLAGVAAVLPAPVFLWAAMKAGANDPASAIIPGAVLLLYLGTLMVSRRYAWADASLYGASWRWRLGEELGLPPRGSGGRVSVRFPVGLGHQVFRGLLLAVLMGLAWKQGQPKPDVAIRAVERSKAEVEAAREGAQKRGEERAKAQALAKFPDPANIQKAIQAATAGDLQAMKALLSQDKRLASAPRTDGQTPLHWAAREGHAGLVSFLLANGADPNAPEDRLGATPLHWAASQGRIDAAGQLLDAGANIEVRAKDGQTPLHGAVYALNREMVEYLLKRGADVNARDNANATPIRYADKRRDEPMKRFLMKKGGRV